MESIEELRRKILKAALSLKEVETISFSKAFSTHDRKLEEVTVRFWLRDSGKFKEKIDTPFSQKVVFIKNQSAPKSNIEEICSPT